MLKLFLLSLLLIVVMHEAAHAIVATICKCKIESITLGFGKTLLKKKIGSIVYELKLLPFGGSCNLKGEIEETRSKYAFVNLPYHKKFLIAIAGCTMNIICGIFMILGLKIQSIFLYYFGFLSLLLGCINLLPIVPCLDGGYIVWFPLLTKIYGKKKGFKIFSKLVKITFKIVLWLNILCIPYLIYLFTKGY